MSDHVTDEMVEAASRELMRRPEFYSETLWKEDIREALTAALAVAPTVGGYVWCERTKHIDRYGSHPDHLTSGCPGPHRTLLLGPAVEEDDDDPA